MADLLPLLLTGDVAGVAACLDAHPELAAKPVRWRPWDLPDEALHEPLSFVALAPSRGQPLAGRAGDLARALLAAGAPPDGGGVDVPLVHAAVANTVDVARALLAAGADLHAVDTREGLPHGTPLDHACEHGAREVVDLLVAHGADVSSLRLAAGAGRPELVARFLPTDDGVDALRIAVVCDRLAVVDTLLDADPGLLRRGEGATALHWAAWQGRARMAAHLLARGADPDVTDTTFHTTPAGWAAMRLEMLGPDGGHAEVLRVLRG